MIRILVVANQTLGCPELVDSLEDYLAPEGLEVHVVAPVTATEGQHQWDYPPVDRYIPDPQQIAHALAAGRLEHESARLRARGVTVTGEVVDADPVRRVQALVGESAFDEIVVCTLPERFSRWLRIDLPQRLRRATGVTIHHIQGSAGPSL